MIAALTVAAFTVTRTTILAYAKHDETTAVHGQTTAVHDETMARRHDEPNCGG
jgi:hypothetical protein